MQLHNLTPAVGSNKADKRIARGQGSGKGGTATRGHKGNQSRAGYKTKRKHEGGQTAIQMRLPKRGFNNSHRRYSTFSATEFTPFNVGLLGYYAEAYDVKVIDLDFLYEVKAVKATELYKVLGDGELTQALEVSAYRFSASAIEAITKAGGKAYFIFKLSQIQGLVHKYALKYVNAATISKYFDYVPEGSNIHVIADGGELSLKFDLQVAKIDDLAKHQVESLGGTITLG